MLRYSRLTDLQAERIHAASLEILERIGVRVHSAEALDLLSKAGAQISGEGSVRIPPHLVESALRTVPKQVVLFNRHGDPAMVLEGDKCYFGPGSDCLNIIDHRTGERRKPVMQDVIEGATLCDALGNIDFVMSQVLPTDVNQIIADTYQAQAMFANTTKPVILVSYELRGLADAVEMAEAIAGSADALSEKPNLTCYINVPSGALHNEESLQKLIFLSKKGLPVIYIPGSNAGVTSPATMAGAVALDNAGGLLGLVISQLIREGTPYVMSAMDPAALDMRTMVSPYAYPERGIIRSLAQRYQLPSFALSGSTDAKLVDQQACAEAAMTLMADVLMGGNIVHDLGYLESGLTFSFVQLAICDQMVDWVKTFFGGIEVNEETLALDVIANVGAEGQYLKQKHTKTHFRETWYPDLFERGSYNDWVQKGSMSLSERAAMKVSGILTSHQPEPLPDHAQAAIQAIVERAKA